LEKKKSRGESKHFTGKYTLASSHPHLEGENKYLLRNGLKTFLLEYCFLGAGVDSHMPEPCHPPERFIFWFIYLFFFPPRMVTKTNKRRSCGRRGAEAGALGCPLLLPSCTGCSFLRAPRGLAGGGDSPEALGWPKPPNRSCYKYPTTPLREAVGQDEAVALGKGLNPGWWQWSGDAEGVPAPQPVSSLPGLTEAGDTPNHCRRSAGYCKDLPWELGNLIGL